MRQYLKCHQFVLVEHLLVLQRDNHIADGDAVSVDGHILHLTLLIVFVTPADGQGGRIVGRTFHLVDIPVGLQVFQVAVAGIGAHTLYLVVVPKGERVVVAVGEDDGLALVLQRHQVVVAEVATGVTA